LVGAMAVLLCTVVLFMGAMSAFAEVGVGSFIGTRSLDVSVQGQERLVPIMCQWGPGIGFWLYVIAGLVLVGTLLMILYQKRKKKIRLL